MGNDSVTASASRRRSTSAPIALAGIFSAAACVKLESRAATAALQVSSWGRSTPVKNARSASTPPHSKSSNVEAPSPSNKAATKSTAMFAAATESSPAVRRGPHAVRRRLSASVSETDAKCAARSATARSTAARRCGVSLGFFPEPAPASAILATMLAALPDPTPEGTTWSRGVVFPVFAASVAFFFAAAAPAVVSGSKRCAHSVSTACTVPSLQNARRNVSGSLCISDSIKYSATSTTLYFSFITESRTEASPARKDAICPGFSAASPSASISGGA
mmetsp:Transcript_5455/g.20576  ORF Transcript_5455/g.20576 Transcript_5455/m.20576 type:complete len:277 (-) Transcript_5455:1368-2198(-)